MSEPLAPGASADVGAGVSAPVPAFVVAPAPASTAAAPPAGTLVDELYSRVRAAVVGDKVTPAGLMIMLSTAMSLVEVIMGLSGMQKKHLVMHLIERVVDEVDDSLEKVNLRAFVDSMMSPVIDTLAAAAAGRLGINVRKVLESLAPAPAPAPQAAAPPVVVAPVIMAGGGSVAAPARSPCCACQ